MSDRFRFDYCECGDFRCQHVDERMKCQVCGDSTQSADGCHVFRYSDLYVDTWPGRSVSGRVRAFLEEHPEPVRDRLSPGAQRVYDEAQSDA